MALEDTSAEDLGVGRRPEAKEEKDRDPSASLVNTGIAASRRRIARKLDLSFAIPGALLQVNEDHEDYSTPAKLVPCVFLVFLVICFCFWVRSFGFPCVFCFLFGFLRFS